MKTINLIQLVFIILLVAGITNTGCRKKKDNTDTSSMTQLSKDESDMQSASDDAATDASDVLSRGTAKSTEWIPCNATLDSVVTANDTITYTITYNGTNCQGGRIRQGVVKVSKLLNTHWRDLGAIVRITFINLKITKISTGRYITVNGTKTITNVSGGVIRELNGSGSVIHSANGSLIAIFDNGTTRTWNVSRKRTFTGTQTDLIVTVEGTGSAEGYTNLVTWGTNRNGEPFYTQINTPVIHKQTCDWDPISGVKVHNIPSDDKKATITFGFDASGNTVSGNNCPTHCKVDWQKGSHSGTILHAI